MWKNHKSGKKCSQRYGCECSSDKKIVGRERCPSVRGFCYRVAVKTCRDLATLILQYQTLLSKDRNFQDANPGVEHGYSAGGVAPGLHATRLPHTHGVRRHPQEDCPLPQVSTKKTELNHTKPCLPHPHGVPRHTQKDCPLPQIFTKPNQIKPYQISSFCHRGVRRHTQEDCPLPQVCTKQNGTKP